MTSNTLLDIMASLLVTIGAFWAASLVGLKAKRVQRFAWWAAVAVAWEQLLWWLQRGLTVYTVNNAPGTTPFMNVVFTILRAVLYATALVMFVLGAVEAAKPRLKQPDDVT